MRQKYSSFDLQQTFWVKFFKERGLRAALLQLVLCVAGKRKPTKVLVTLVGLSVKSFQILAYILWISPFKRRTIIGCKYFVSSGAMAWKRSKCKYRYEAFYNRCAQFHPLPLYHWQPFARLNCTSSFVLFHRYSTSEPKLPHCLRGWGIPLELGCCQHHQRHRGWFFKSHSHRPTCFVPSQQIWLVLLHSPPQQL